MAIEPRDVGYNVIHEAYIPEKSSKDFTKQKAMTKVDTEYSVFAKDKKSGEMVKCTESYQTSYAALNHFTRKVQAKELTDIVPDTKQVYKRDIVVDYYVWNPIDQLPKEESQKEQQGDNTKVIQTEYAVFLEEDKTDQEIICTALHATQEEAEKEFEQLCETGKFRHRNINTKVVKMRNIVMEYYPWAPYQSIKIDDIPIDTSCISMFSLS